MIDKSVPARGERDQRHLKRLGKMHERGGLRPVPCASPTYIATTAIQLIYHAENRTGRVV